MLWLELWNGPACFGFIHSSWMSLKQKIRATGAPTALQLLTRLEKAKPKSAPQNQSSLDAKSSLPCMTDPLLPDCLLQRTFSSDSVVLWWCNSMNAVVCLILLLLYFEGSKRSSDLLKLVITCKQVLGATALMLVLLVLCTALAVQSGITCMRSYSVHSKYFLG